MRTGLTPENADQRRAAFVSRVDPGKIVETVRGAFIDGEALCAIGLDNVAEGRKGFPCERGREKFERFQS